MIIQFMHILSLLRRAKMSDYIVTELEFDEIIVLD
jgi:hypothetical protein